MRKKLPVIDRTMSIESQNANPGSGQYEDPEALSPRGRYSISKHKGTGAALFNPKRSIRFFQFRILFLYIRKCESWSREVLGDKQPE